MSASVVFIYSLKGGVAKTTTVVNLAGVLGQLGKRVLVIDLDPQAAATWMLAQSPQHIEGSTYVALMGTKPIQDIIQRTHFSNVDVAPSSAELYGLDSDIETVTTGRGQLLVKALSPIRNMYDIVLIDAHNKYGLTELNALHASDFLLIPVSCSILPYWGLEELDQLLLRAASNGGPHPEVLGYVITMFHRKILRLNAHSKDIEQQLRVKYGDMVFRTVLDYDDSIDEAASNQEPVSYYRTHARGAVEYEHLAREVLDRINGCATKRGNAR
ncbi:MAG: ParA family protein [Nitrososphaerota archaeon]|nr:ParA family protein [Nitrososphaerota archaeon]